MATPLVIAVTTGLLFMMGGSLVLAASWLVPSQFAHLDLLRMVAGSAVFLGTATMLLRRRLRPPLAHALVAVGTASITVGVQVAGPSPAGVAVSFLYVLIAVDSAFFFAWPAAVVHLLSAVAACVLVMIVGWGTGGGDSATGAGAALLVTGIAVVVAGVVAWLVRAASAAEIDPLTGLPNRRKLDRLLDQAIDDAERSGRPLCTAVLDMDHFRAVNDRVGRPEGSALLASATRAWAAVLPPSVTLTRPGGDEFTVILPGYSLTAAMAVMQAVRAATPRPHTCSVGVAQWDPEAPSAMLTDAEQALHAAKRSGRNRVHQHNDTTSIRVEVGRALADGELTVYHQPVIAMDSGTLCGTEALLRWRHPQRGLVAPGEFLPALEASGLMADIGRYVLDSACRQVARWRDTDRSTTVAVNVTGTELEDCGYADHVAQVLLQYGLSGSSLILEVTEASLAAETGAALTTLRRLRTLGVRIAVDDFGTGYSSLGRLERLPVDILKIDQSFVRTVGPDAASAPLIQAILALASALELEVVAEGVEHPHQARLLRDLGCGRAQGYLFGHPVPPEDLDLVRGARAVALRQVVASAL